MSKRNALISQFSHSFTVSSRITVDWGSARVDTRLACRAVCTRGGATSCIRAGSTSHRRPCSRRTLETGRANRAKSSLCEEANSKW